MLELGMARRAELPELVALLGLLFSQEAEFTPDPGKQARALETVLEDASKGALFVARDDGRVVAMASLIYTVSTAEGGAAALFEDLVVHPRYRRQGVATRLVRFVIEQARLRGVLRLTLLTDPQNRAARALYRKLGFANSPMQAMRLRL